VVEDQPIGRGLLSDRLVTALVAIGAAVVFFVCFSPHPSLEDSAESIAGVKSFGIVHAPGYPTYMIAARLFSTIEPFGSWAFRVNLFSVVCASAAMALVYRAGRHMGATMIGAVAGSATLATALSIWFYAGYAKAYSMTLLLLAAALVLVLRWRETNATRELVGAVVAVGLAGGAAYQSVVLSIPALAAGVFTAARRPSFRQVLVAIAGGIAALGLVLGFMMVRASAHPAVNWGEPTTPSRVTDVLTMRDFGFSERVFASSGAPPTTSHRRTGIVRKLDNARKYGVLLTREFSWPLIIVAVLGMVTIWLHRGHRSLALLLTLLIGVNVVAVATFIGSGTSRGAESAIRIGGFLIAADVGFALLVALGTTRLIEFGDPARPFLFQAASSVGAVAVVGGLLLATVHHVAPAQHRSTRFVDHYAEDVFATVPHGALLFVRSAEWQFPLRYEQIVRHRRPDIDVVVLNLLSRPWYREQMRRQLHQRVIAGSSMKVATELARSSLATRPVWLDLPASVEFRHSLGFRQLGLTAEVQPGPKITAAPIADQLDLLDRRYHNDGLFTDPARKRYPNRALLQTYVLARVQVAGQLVAARKNNDAVAQLRRALEIDPTNLLAHENLNQLTGAGAG
jgi:hypothetical protein